jgi:hypothetical protein
VATAAADHTSLWFSRATDAIIPADMIANLIVKVTS